MKTIAPIILIALLLNHCHSDNSNEINLEYSPSKAELFAEGSRTLGQDEASSIVYGMPRVAWELGGVMEQVPLDAMADTINRYAREFGI